ncbi:MAG: cation diffusion facilitator family transporter [Leptospirales bacterium]|nr:cation diffusion facilitator family transporter [Leptospirales bacterium]MCL2155145.1 cation diffusion facilitator family transporter [Leptospirales bacterium]
MDRSFIIRYIRLSIAAAIFTIFLKSAAWYLTGSVGLLSDAFESVINLLAAIMAMVMLKIAHLPPDENHEFGHGKAEYFSSFVEGILILIAAVGIIYTAVVRFFDPQQIEQLGIGLLVSFTAAAINFVVARILLKAGKKYRSITLESDSYHLMTDVWTSAGVIIGVGIAGITGWVRLDSIVAFLVGINIIVMAYKIIKRSVAGLMDASLSSHELEIIESVFDGYRKKGIIFHALLTRQGAFRRFVSVHVLVSNEMTVHDAHHIADNIEEDIRKALKNTVVFTHLEPLEDEISFDDITIDR